MFTLIVNFRDGRRAFLRHREKARDQARDDFDRRYTLLRRWAVQHATLADAEEQASRLHGVQANGHYWQDVLFFEPVRISSPAERRARRRRATLCPDAISTPGR